MPSPKDAAVARLKEILAKDREACRRADALEAADLMALPRGATFATPAHAALASSIIPIVS